MNRQRPINLDLGSLTYPPMAIASILHRISGIILFLCFPVVLYFLHCSLVSESSFLALLVLFENPFCKLMLWGFCSALVYHLIAGIRHMLMDIGLGETLVASRRSAQAVMLISFCVVVFLGVWIW